MNYNLSNINEEEARGPIDGLKFGINDCILTNIRVDNFKSKDGKDLKALAIDIWDVKKSTYKDKKTQEVKPFIFTKKWLEPTDSDQMEKFLKRIVHLFSKVNGSTKVDAAKEYLQKINVTSLEDLVATLKKIGEGKQVRLKIVADYTNKKYFDIPSYFSGWAECVDVKETQLKYDAEKEGPVKKDEAKVENTASGTTSKEDDLPF